MFIVYFWGTSIRPTLYICDIFAHPTVFNGHTSDSRTFEKMTVKNATIIKMHYINDIRLYNIYRSFFFVCDHSINLLNQKLFLSKLTHILYFIVESKFIGMHACYRYISFSDFDLFEKIIVVGQLRSA